MILVAFDCAGCGKAVERPQYPSQKKPHKYCSLQCSGRHAHPRIPLAERVWSNVEKTPTCWLWTGTISGGYGVIGLGGHQSKMTTAHRLVYRLLVGPVPDELHVDHLCHNADLSCPGGSTCPHRRCVNPDHLEPVTTATNVLRGRGFGAVNAAKEACIRGHLFDAANTHITRAGRRHCRTCARIRERLRKCRRQRAGKGGAAR